MLGLVVDAVAVEKALTIYKHAGGDNAEKESGDVGQIGNTAGSDLGDCADIQNLHEEPEADEQDGGDVGDSEKDEVEENGANSVARKGNEESSHDGGNSAACAEYRDGGRRVGDYLRHHSDEASGKVEQQEAERAHSVFNFRPECPEVDHVADDVHPAGVHEHGAEKSEGVMPGSDAEGNCRPGSDEAVSAAQLKEKEEDVGNNDERGDGGRPPGSARGVAERDKAGHYIPPFRNKNPILKATSPFTSITCSNCATLAAQRR